MDIPSLFDLSGRSAVVTGAGGGIGGASARFLAAAGASVVCADIDESGAEATSASIAAEGGAAVAVPVDVTSRESVEALYRRTVDTWGGVDIAVNCAGILRYTPALELSEEEYDRVLAVNLKGVFLCCQSAGRRMEHGGSIVNVASAVIDEVNTGLTTYATSKGGVVQLTRVFAHELAPKGVRVNGIAPGWVESGLTRHWFTDEHGQVDEERRRQVIAARAALSPLNTVGTPEDMAAMVLFLASGAARFCTGQVYRVNGGSHMV